MLENSIKLKCTNNKLYQFEAIKANNYCKTDKIQIIGFVKQTIY